MSKYLQNDIQGGTIYDEDKIRSSVSQGPQNSSNLMRSESTETNASLRMNSLERSMSVDLAKPAMGRYQKIQPMIAIKPKPSPISVLPKPSSTSAKGFDMTSKSTLKSDITLSINTSRKWVLPPRPRPGRKPTTPSSDENLDSTVKINNRPSTKKRVKTNRGLSSEAEESTASSPGIEEPRMAIRQGFSVSSASSKIVLPESNDTINLKVVYLNKLKEQDLITNYIEILRSQIQELNFVQNGVITSNALYSNPRTDMLEKNKDSSKNPAGSTYSQCEQLERINNINDLNKFLTYLTRSSNIIRSATKKYAGVNNGNNLNTQIKSYLEIRSKNKLTQNKINGEKIKKTHHGEFEEGSQEGSRARFVPDVLKPRQDSDLEYSFANLAKTETTVIKQLDDIHKIVNQEIEDDVIVSSDFAEEEDLKSTATMARAQPKHRSFSCGFCTEDTCLCRETEADLAQLK